MISSNVLYQGDGGHAGRVNNYSDVSLSPLSLQFSSQPSDPSGPAQSRSSTTGTAKSASSSVSTMSTRTGNSARRTSTRLTNINQDVFVKLTMEISKHSPDCRLNTRASIVCKPLRTLSPSVSRSLLQLSLSLSPFTLGLTLPDTFYY